MAHEVLQSINLLGSPAMILKLYMTKAYDKVKSLTQVKEKLGFHCKWIKRIMSCILGAKFSVLVNGTSCGFFSSLQGVRQGDSLSPFFVHYLS